MTEFGKFPNLLTADEHLNDEEHKPRKAYTLIHRHMNSLSAGCRLNEFIKNSRNAYKNPECMSSLNAKVWLSEFTTFLEIKKHEHKYTEKQN